MPRVNAGIRGRTQNIVTYSDSTYLSPWAPVRAIAVQYVGSLPSGYADAALVTDDANNNSHVIRQNYAITTSGSFVMSAVVKKISGNNWCALGILGFGSNAFFDLANGVAGSITGAARNPAIVALDNGWFRCSIQFTSTDISNSRGIALASADGVINYAGGANQIAVCGVMIEQAIPGQTTPSPYIATGASPLNVYGMREWRQNWLRYSDDVSQTSGWTRTRLSSITTDGTLQPNGITMQKVAEDATASATHQLSQTTASNIDKARFRTYYAILKAGSRTFACLALDGGNQGAMFDLSNGTIGQNNMVRGGSASIASLGNGCYLCAITGDVLGGSSQQCNLYLATSSLFTGLTYSGNGSGYIYVGQTGVVCGSGPVDHITTTSAVANASGAPRSLAGARTAAGSRTAA